MVKQMTRDVVAFARMMLGAMVAAVLLAWMAAAFLVGVAVMLSAKGVVLLAHAIKRLCGTLRIARPTTTNKRNCAAEAVIDV